MAALLLCWVGVPPSSAFDQGGGAREWFKWTPSQREAYVAGWAMGIAEGFSMGCASGFDARYVPGKDDDDVRFEKDCISRHPLRAAHPNLSAGQVTQFYRRYPALRGVPVVEILRDLASGDTVDQVHDRLTDHRN